MSFVIITNLDRFLEGLNRLPEEMRNSIQNAMQDVVERIYMTAWGLSPVRTGFLQSSIYFMPIGEWSFMLAARAPYAIYVELGTRYMAPRLFMHRAIEMRMQELPDQIVKAVVDCFTKVFSP